MKIEVRLFATLARDAGRHAGVATQVDLHDRATFDDLLETLGITKNQIHLVIIDGRVAHHPPGALRDGCRIGLFPPVGGG